MHLLDRSALLGLDASVAPSDDEDGVDTNVDDDAERRSQNQMQERLVQRLAERIIDGRLSPLLPPSSTRQRQKHSAGNGILFHRLLSNAPAVRL